MKEMYQKINRQEKNRTVTLPSNPTTKTLGHVGMQLSHQVGNLHATSVMSGLIPDPGF